MGWKKLVIVGLSFLLVSCLGFYHHPKGGFRPKKSNFSLNKKEFIYNSNIDTLAIYTNIDTLKVEDLKRVSYLKFYSNGRFLKKSRNINNKINISNIIPGAIGYFYLDDNKNIITEYFSVDYFNKKNIKYIKQKGRVNNDTIFLKNNIDTSYTEIYIKQKLDFIPQPPNW